MKLVIETFERSSGDYVALIDGDDHDEMGRGTTERAAAQDAVINYFRAVQPPDTGILRRYAITPTDILTMLQKYIEERPKDQLRLRYTPPQSPETLRRVYPIKFLGSGNALRVLAREVESSELRSFYLNRIVSLEEV